MGDECIRSLARSIMTFKEKTGDKNFDPNENIRLSNEFYIVNRIGNNPMQIPVLGVIDDEHFRIANNYWLFKLNDDSEMRTVFSGFYLALSELLVDSIKSSVTPYECKLAFTSLATTLGMDTDALGQYTSNLADLPSETISRGSNGKLGKFIDGADNVLGNVVPYVNPLVRWVATAGLLIASVALFKEGGWEKYLNDEGELVGAPEHWIPFISAIATSALTLGSGYNAVIKGKQTLGMHDLADTVGFAFTVLNAVFDGESSSSRSHHRSRTRAKSAPSHPHSSGGHRF